MLNKSLTLTIVIPARDEERYITACLDAIAAQETAPDEVIVVNNGSADKTAQIAAGYAFVKVINEDQLGIVFARNRGFNAGTSDLLARIDADTVLPKHWVKQVKSIYNQAGRPALYAATGPSDFRNRFGHFWYAAHRLTYFWPGRLILGHSTLVGSNMFISRALWMKVKGQICLRTEIHEDMDLAYHIGKTKTPVIFHNRLKASIAARKMTVRIFSYPLMMLRIRLNWNHFFGGAMSR